MTGTTRGTEEQDYLLSLGYRLTLRRTLGTFDSFAFAFSYFSAIFNLTLHLGLGEVSGCRC